MREVRRDADLGAVAFHQLIDAASAHIEYWNATIGLVCEFDEGVFLVESAYPHRIVRWEWKQAARQKVSSGRSSVRSPDVTIRPEGNDAGELTGSARLEYWKLHGVGDERHLAKVGLKPVPR